jgi:hypothetical protein
MFRDLNGYLPRREQLPPRPKFEPLTPRQESVLMWVIGFKPVDGASRTILRIVGCRGSAVGDPRAMRGLDIASPTSAPLPEAILTFHIACQHVSLSWVCNGLSLIAVIRSS